MLVNEYLRKVLVSQSIAEDSPEMKSLLTEKEKVQALILKKFKDSNPLIKIAGSNAKGTAILESYDLDICTYFSCDDENCGSTLEEIFHNVKKSLETNYFVLVKPTALRLQNKSIEKFGVDYHIDVVPGSFVDETKGDAFLHKSTGEKKYFKTNLKVHISHVKNSGLTEIIKLLKLWKMRFGLLTIKTFILELLIIKILKDYRHKPYEDLLKIFWEKIKSNVENISIEDPANPYGNDLSESFDLQIKAQLKSGAQRALDLILKDDWKTIFGEISKKQNVTPAIISVATSYVNPPKPFSC